MEGTKYAEKYEGMIDRSIDEAMSERMDKFGTLEYDNPDIEYREMDFDDVDTVADMAVTNDMREMFAEERAKLKEDVESFLKETFESEESPIHFAENEGISLSEEDIDELFSVILDELIAGDEDEIEEGDTINEQVEVRTEADAGSIGED